MHDRFWKWYWETTCRNGRKWQEAVVHQKCCGKEARNVLPKSYYCNHMMIDKCAFPFPSLLLISHVIQIRCPNSSGLKMKNSILIFLKFLCASQEYHPHVGKTNRWSCGPKKDPNCRCSECHNSGLQCIGRTVCITSACNMPDSNQHSSLLWWTLMTF